MADPANNMNPDNIANKIEIAGQVVQAAVEGLATKTEQTKLPKLFSEKNKRFHQGPRSNQKN